MAIYTEGYFDFMGRAAGGVTPTEFAEDMCATSCGDQNGCMKNRALRISAYAIGTIICGTIATATVIGSGGLAPLLISIVWGVFFLCMTAREIMKTREAKAHEIPAAQQAPAQAPVVAQEPEYVVPEAPAWTEPREPTRGDIKMLKECFRTEMQRYPDARELKFIKDVFRKNPQMDIPDCVVVPVQMAKQMDQQMKTGANQAFVNKYGQPSPTEQAFLKQVLIDRARSTPDGVADRARELAAKKERDMLQHFTSVMRRNPDDAEADAMRGQLLGYEPATASKAWFEQFVIQPAPSVVVAEPKPEKSAAERWQQQEVAKAKMKNAAALRKQARLDMEYQALRAEQNEERLRRQEQEQAAATEALVDRQEHGVATSVDATGTAAIDKVCHFAQSEEPSVVDYAHGLGDNPYEAQDRIAGFPEGIKATHEEVVYQNNKKQGPVKPAGTATRMFRKVGRLLTQ